MTVFFDASMIKKGEPLTAPPRICVYGVPGVGKSSLGESFPNPIFCPLEDGARELTVDQCPKPAYYGAVEDFLDFLIVDKHKYVTVVFDTIDWLEKLIFKKIAEENGKEQIEEIDYKAGYQMALKYWDSFLAKLEELQAKKKMIVLFLAHSIVKTYNSPMTEPYDRYQMAMHKYGLNRIYQWCDAVLFCNYQIFTSTQKLPDGKKKIQATGGEDRIFYTQERPAYWAKNRYRLPPEMPFKEGEGWNELKKYLSKPKKKTAVAEKGESSENGDSPKTESAEQPGA